MAYTTIDKPSDYFEPITFTASNASSNTVSGMGFQPDLIWWKNREQTYPHFLYDVIRGNTKQLASNTTGAEETRDSTYLTSFNSDGFTTGTALAGDTSDGIVSWNWKAGTSFTNDASATGIGSIDSSGSVNTDAGFAIITYTGTGSAGTIAHGLGATPDFIITKRIDGVDSWMNWNKTFSATQYLQLNETNAVASASTVFGTLPTSTVYSTGGGTGTGASGGNFISYCFAEKQGYSKFGSYTGNGNADGPFVYTGLKPAFVMMKRSSDGTNDWTIFDNKRPGYNLINKALYPNGNWAEGTGNALDFTSNGFKWRTSAVSYNASGATYIYMAFAENPLVTSTGIPACAR